MTHAIKVVPKHEETIDGWLAFSVTAVQTDGHVIRWSLYERSPGPRRATGRLSRLPAVRAA